MNQCKCPICGLIDEFETQFGVRLKQEIVTLTDEANGLTCDVEADDDKYGPTIVLTVPITPPVRFDRPGIPELINSMGVNGCSPVLRGSRLFGVSAMVPGLPCHPELLARALSLLGTSEGLRVTIYVSAGRRKFIRVGRISKRSASLIDRYVQMLAEAKRLGMQPEPGVTEWLRCADESLRVRILRARLISEGQLTPFAEAPAVKPPAAAPEVKQSLSSPKGHTSRLVTGWAFEPCS